MKALFTRLCLLWLIPVACPAQNNLVRNASFEAYNMCPNSISAVAKPGEPEDFLKNWFAPTQGTTDYFNACSQFDTSVPANLIGYQAAVEGNGYAGIVALATDDTTNNDRVIREYLLNQLVAPLEKDKRYCISFYASPGETAGDGTNRKYMFGIKDLGLYVSTTPTTAIDSVFNAPPLPFTPQITTNTVMDDTDLWYLISGIYVATGGEEWITIGNFKLNTEMHGMKLISPGFVNDYYKYSSYYFIDNVQVFEADNPHILPADMLVCEKDFPVNVTASPDLENYHWNTGETSKSITSSQGGLYTLEANKGACALHDTIQVTLSPTPVLDLGDDIQNCEAGVLKTVTLKNSTALFSYSWSTGAHTAEIDVSAAGTYRLSTYDYCGTFADEIVVLGCEPAIYVPNVFAPSIAGVNGIFLPQGQNVSFERLVVFNNWGVLVYQEDTPMIGWNGTFNWQSCPPGVYVWHLSYRIDGDSKVLTKQGNVTLIR